MAFGFFVSGCQYQCNHLAGNDLLWYVLSATLKLTHSLTSVAHVGISIQLVVIGRTLMHYNYNYNQQK